MEFPELKERLYQHLTQLVRQRDPYLASAGHFFVQEYIRDRLQQWGTVTTHEFKIRGIVRKNLILDLKGRNQQKLPPILIGAHYDAVPGTPGADDNATGVAVLLELAQAFATEPLRYPVRLVAFDLANRLGSPAPYSDRNRSRDEKAGRVYENDFIMDYYSC